MQLTQEVYDTLVSFSLPLIVIVISVVFAYGLKAIIDRHHPSWQSGDGGRGGLVMLKVMEGLVVPGITLVGLSIALQVSSLPADLHITAQKAVATLLTLIVTLVSVRALSVITEQYVTRVESLSEVSAVLKRIGQILIWTIGLMVGLAYLGVNITPLLTTLGVGGLAAALALQDTLANFFAGFYILADRPIRVGDYIKLSSGEEGYVTEIGWRSAKIRTLPNNVVIVPNQKLSQSIITNYHLPEPRMSLLVPVGVSYGSDPYRVEELLVDVATIASMEIEGMLSDPSPFVRFIPGFGEYSLDFTLICHVREFVDQYYVQHELRKRIFARFQQEGIEIPFPVRTLQLQNVLNGQRKTLLHAGLDSLAIKDTISETNG